MQPANSSFASLIGKTITSIEGLKEGSESATFLCSDGSKMKMFHYQECCEGVSICEVHGSIDDLIGQQVLSAEEASNVANSSNGVDEWTFYHIRTIRGTVTIRWFGESNGYYSTAPAISFSPYGDAL